MWMKSSSRYPEEKHQTDGSFRRTEKVQLCINDDHRLEVTLNSPFYLPSHLWWPCVKCVLVIWLPCVNRALPYLLDSSVAFNFFSFLSLNPQPVLFRSAPVISFLGALSFSLSCLFRYTRCAARSQPAKWGERTGSTASEEKMEKWRGLTLMAIRVVFFLFIWIERCHAMHCGKGAGSAAPASTSTDKMFHFCTHH